MVAVLDAPAIIEVHERAIDPLAAFEWLGEEIAAGRAFFPNAVVEHLRRLGGNAHPALMWIGTARSQRLRDNPAVHCWHYAVDELPDLVDHEPPERCFIHVAAMAHEFQQEGVDVTVVTEDVHDKTRISLATGCSRLGIAWTRTAPWLVSKGHSVNDP